MYQLKNLRLAFSSVIGGFVFLCATQANAQILVEISNYSNSLPVEIVNHSPDERWQIVGHCKGDTAQMHVKIVQSYGDKKVQIVQGSADRRICITNAHTLDSATLQELQLR